MVFLRRIPPSGGGRKSTPPADVSAGNGSQKRADDGADAAMAAAPADEGVSSSKSTVASQLCKSSVDHDRRSQGETSEEEDLRIMLSVLADAGCTLCSSGPPLLPDDTHEFRRRLERRLAPLQASLSQENPVLGQFVSGLFSYASRGQNLRRILVPAAREGLSGANGPSDKAESLARLLLSVAPLQPRIQHLLLERLPEYFDAVDVSGKASLSSSALEDDIARLIVHQFRWLDFVVDPERLSEKLMEVLSICPLPLKKEIIGSLPEIIGDCANCAGVVEALEKMLHEDSELIVPILDAFSNLNFSSSQLEQIKGMWGG